MLLLQLSTPHEGKKAPVSIKNLLFAFSVELGFARPLPSSDGKPVMQIAAGPSCVPTINQPSSLQPLLLEEREQTQH